MKEKTIPEGQDFDAALEGVVDEVEKQAPETRDEEMERLRQEVAEAEKRVLMAQAEAENFRKRTRRDLEEQLKYASQDLVNDILEVRDNLVRALAVAQSADADTSGLREGVAMVTKQLDDKLAKYHIHEIPTDGAFDPNMHQAISQMPSQTHAAGTIVHVAQSGFTLHERVVRPSQVIVSTGPHAS
jgi:molecular chaperone GrpE